MPSSNFGHLFDVLSSVVLINPKSILEVGVGFGKYGYLFREYLDLAYDEETGGYKKWRRIIDGIEINDKYLTPVHEYIYNNIYIGNALEILKNMKTKYDLIVAIDLIEHFTKSDGYEFIREALTISDNIVIATPYIYYKQGEVFGNQYETHLSGWDYLDFIKQGAKYIWRKGINLIAIFSNRDLPLPLAKNLTIPDLDKIDLQNMLNLIKMYNDTNQYEQCIDCCLQYIKYYKNDLRVLSIYGEVLEKTGKREEALDIYSYILEIDSSNRAIQKKLSEQNKNIIITPINRDLVLLFKGGFQYNVVNYFIDELAKDFEKLGLKTLVIDLMAKDSFYKTEKHIFNDNLKFMFSFNGIGIDYLVSLAEASKVPLITFYLDSPIYHYNRLQYKSDFLKIIYMDKNDTNFLKEVLGIEATFIPHGAVTLFPKKQYQKNHNIIFAGSVEEPQIYRDRWLQLGNIIAGIYDDLLEYLLDREYFNIKSDVDFILREKGIELNNDRKSILYQNAVFVHKYIRSYRRIKILEKLTDFEIDIYGNGWDKFNPSKKHRVHKSLDFQQLVEEIAKSKLLLNVLPEFIYGGHERIFTSMYYGTPVLTNSNYYLNSILKNNQDIVYYSWKKYDELPGIVLDILSDEDKLLALSVSGSDKVREKHTWLQRAEQILLLTGVN